MKRRSGNVAWSAAQLARYDRRPMGIGALFIEDRRSKGDRVLIFMPDMPEGVMTMLASARLGAVHSVVFAGFASRELAARIDDTQPKVIVWASCGIEPGRVVAYKPLLDGALALAAHQPAACVVLQRSAGEAVLDPGRDHEWTAAVEAAEPVNECVPVLATDPLYILYTSGTTGKPRGALGPDRLFLDLHRLVRAAPERS